MIECPICHSPNDERSHFCAECGQRFKDPASQGQSAGPHISSNRLHSPILDGGSSNDSEKKLRPFGKVLGAASVRNPRPEENPDPPETKDPGNISKTNRHGLHSPLLHFGEEENEVEVPKPQAGGMFPHRSKDLNHGLPQSPSGSNIPHLRSPLLGGGEDTITYLDVDINAAVDNDPDALRSPLLKVRSHDMPQAAPKLPKLNENAPRIPPQGQGAPIPEGFPEPSPAPKVPGVPYQMDPNIQGRVEVRPGLESPPIPKVPGPLPTTPPMGGFGAPPPPAPAASVPAQIGGFPAPLNNASQFPPSNPPIANFQPPDSQTPGIPIVNPQPFVAQPKTQSTPSAPASIQPANKTSWADDTAVGARLNQLGSSDSLPQRAGHISSRSKLLPASEETSIERKSASRSQKHIQFAKFMLIPLFCAVGFKVWYLMAMGQTALQSMPFLGDQISQLVVIVCLMIFTYLATL